MVKYNKWLDLVDRVSFHSVATDAIRLDKSERIVDFDSTFFNTFMQSLNQEDIRLYPNTNQLKKSIAEYCSLNSSNIYISYGSDNIIKTMFECFVEKNSDVVTSSPCFPMYDVYAKLFNSNLLKVDYDYTLELSIQNIINKITNQTRLVLLANPNSPIGDFKSASELESLFWYTNMKGIAVLIDEAYKEFSLSQITDQETQDIINKFDNVIISRTFSKAFGAAGIRLGYCIGNVETINILNKWKPAFEATGIAIKFAQHLLKNTAVVKDYYNSVIECRHVVSEMLTKASYDVVNSNCNWIHFNDEIDNSMSTKILDKFNVIYRKGCILPYDSRINWIRMSIVPGMENSDYIKALIDDKSVL